MMYQVPGTRYQVIVYTRDILCAYLQFTAARGHVLRKLAGTPSRDR